MGFYGKSDSGKTWLISEIVSKLNAEDYKVAVVKHTDHESFDLDSRGKDTDIFFSGDSKIVIGSAKNQTLIFIKGSEELERLYGFLNYFYNFDFVLAEGFKNLEWLEKIKVGDVEEEKNTVLRFENNLEQILEYLKANRQIEKIHEALPKFDCGECGHKDCWEMARAIYEKNDSFKNCEYWNPDKKISLRVNDKNVYLGKFAQSVLFNTIEGLVKSLKNSDNAESIEIKIKKL
ncbi:MAG: molybdopterin-guanine dinucleotide biosynthesis protein B [Thermoplasmata archaeon]